MNVHVLLYEKGTDSEGIHSLEINGETIVLMFENQDDADRYCLLLEAQDFPKPSVELIARDEIESFCLQSGYTTRFVEEGFVPQNDEDRLLLVPPQQNREVQNWNEIDNTVYEKQKEKLENNNLEDINDIKKRLEDLL